MAKEVYILKKLDSMEDQQFVFGSVIVVANRIDTLLERELKEFDITAKQWFLSIIVDNLFSEPPTIKQAAKEMGSSHQNVKQVALKLEQKGLMVLQKDKKDARATRLKMTDESYKFWATTQSKGLAFNQALFKDIEKEDMSKARKVIEQMLDNLTQMENTQKDNDGRDD